MNLVFGHDAQVGAYVAERIGMSIHPPFVAIGILGDDGKALGGFVYNEYNGSNLSISYYGPHTMTRKVIRAALWSYPFEQAGAVRLSASTRRSNRLVCKLLPRLGFDFEAVLKRYYGPTRKDDAIIFRLDRQKAMRWQKRT